MHNHKVLNDKPNETEINNSKCRNNDTSPLTNSCQTKLTLTVTSLDINKNVTLAHVKQHLKIVSSIIKNRSTK